MKLRIEAESAGAGSGIHEGKVKRAAPEVVEPEVKVTPKGRRDVHASVDMKVTGGGDGVGSSGDPSSEKETGKK